LLLLAFNIRDSYFISWLSNTPNLLLKVLYESQWTIVLKNNNRKKWIITIYSDPVVLVICPSFPRTAWIKLMLWKWVNRWLVAGAIDTLYMNGWVIYLRLFCPVKVIYCDTNILITTWWKTCCTIPLSEIRVGEWWWWWWLTS
jgi:hypothetical protein